MPIWSRKPGDMIDRGWLRRAALMLAVLLLLLGCRAESQTTATPTASRTPLPTLTWTPTAPSADEAPASETPQAYIYPEPAQPTQ